MASAISVYERVKQFKDDYVKNGGKIENYQAEQCIVAIDEKLRQSIECTGFMGAGKGFILRSETSYSCQKCLEPRSERPWRSPSPCADLCTTAL